MSAQLRALLRPGGLALAVLVLVVGVGRADLVTYQFTGTVDTVQGTVLDGMVSPSSTFVGTFTYDKQVADLVPGTGIGFYSGAARDFLVVVDGIHDFALSSTGASTADDSVLLYNTSEQSGFVLAKGNDPGQASLFNPVVRTRHAGLILDLPTLGALNSTDLKNLTLDLSAFNGGTQGLYVCGKVGTDAHFAFSGHLNSLTKIMETPEPATITLFVIGAVGLWLVQRKRWRWMAEVVDSGSQQR